MVRTGADPPRATLGNRKPVLWVAPLAENRFAVLAGSNLLGLAQSIQGISLAVKPAANIIQHPPLVRQPRHAGREGARDTAWRIPF